MNDLVNIVCTDNYARESVADQMWKEQVPRDLAEQICEVLNKYYGEHSQSYFTIYELGTRLSRGMEDLV